MEHQAQASRKMENGKTIQVRAIKGRELVKLGEQITAILAHIYTSKGKSMTSIITSGSKVTLDALFSILEFTSDWKKNALLDLGIADLVKVIEAWLEVNKLEEVAPLFFSLKEQIKKISTSMTPQKQE